MPLGSRYLSDPEPYLDLTVPPTEMATWPGPPEHQHTPSLTDEPFRFLDLPLDLRLMVYEKFLDRTWITLTEDRSPKLNSRPGLALVMQDSIPPIHLTCRSLLDEVVSFLKPLVSRSQIRSDVARIVFWGGKSAGNRWDQELECVLYAIDWLFCSRNYPEFQDEAIQKFVNKTLRTHPIFYGPGDPIWHLTEPIHIVQAYVTDEQRRHIQDLPGRISFGRELSIAIYSTEKQETPSVTETGWVEYKGAIGKEVWDAEWA